jgi:CheY-like chemotaxis protein
MNKAIDILLVEDNPGDVRLTQKMFAKSGFPHSLRWEPDGERALEALGRGPLPDLILLDLNLPRMDGMEFLQSVKSEPRLRSIPVLVLSTSRAAEDVLGSYDRHANCYISKPADAAGYDAVVRAIVDFWLRTAKLPAA